VRRQQGHAQQGGFHHDAPSEKTPASGPARGWRAPPKTAGSSGILRAHYTQNDPAKRLKIALKVYVFRLGNSGYRNESLVRETLIETADIISVTFGENMRIGNIQMPDPLRCFRL
jgi:hypothetical protein